MIIEEIIKESIKTKQKILETKELISRIEKVSDRFVECYKSGGRIFFAGNGGSAADAQHLACELVGRFYLNRRALAAEALNTNTSSLTAISNDYSFKEVFSRQLEANAREGDVFVGISTSGNSDNIIEAIKKCREKNVFVVGFTGRTGGRMKDICDILINVPSDDTPRIQEAHILIGHIICEIVEKKLFGNETDF